MKYAVLTEGRSYPFRRVYLGLARCVAAADTLEEVIALIQEGRIYRIETMLESDDAIPEPTTSAQLIEVALPTRMTVEDATLRRLHFRRYPSHQSKE